MNPKPRRLQRLPDIDTARATSMKVPEKHFDQPVGEFSPFPGRAARGEHSSGPARLDTASPDRSNRPGLTPRERDRAFRRLRRLTALAAISAAGLLAALGFVSAKTYSGTTSAVTVVSAPAQTAGSAGAVASKSGTGTAGGTTPTKVVHHTIKRHHKKHATSSTSTPTSSGSSSTASPTVTSPSPSAGTQATTGGSSVS